MKNYLNFETEIKNLEIELEKLKDPYTQDGLSQVNTDKIMKIEKELDDKLKTIYSNLNSWQTTLVARHEERPKSKYFIDNLIDEFIPLAGDRNYAEDNSLISGFGKFEGTSVLVLGQEKGDDLDSRIERNFGMMRPEGYRKSIRLIQLADRFNIPVLSFIDTPGAYPGVGAEERGQAEAIARSIECSMKISVPNISIIIGEGGSGGAIALASSNKIIMLENAIYSVISPEGCATILWRDPKKTLEASEAMKLTSKDLLEMRIIDEIIKEPTGGAHRNKQEVVNNARISIKKNLDELLAMSRKEIISHRNNKFLSIGRDNSFLKSDDTTTGLISKKNYIESLIFNSKIRKILIFLTLVTILLLFVFLLQ